MLDFIPAEKATELGLTEDQMNGIAPLHSEWLAGQKKDWDGKASKDADLILDNVSKTVAEKYGYSTPRQQGEKYEDYMAKVDEHRFGSLKTDYETKKRDYETKLKNFDGGEAQKIELQQLKEKLDGAQIKLANYDELTEKAGKAEESQTKYEKLKQAFAFTQVRPAFPDTVNVFEADAKYKDFISRVEEKNNIEIDENNVAWAIDKENPHSKKKLSDLVTADKVVSELSQGRKQAGSGARENKGNIAGMEVEIPVGAERSEASQLINAHLDTKKLKGEERTAEFTKIWSQYLKANIMVA